MRLAAVKSPNRTITPYASSAFDSSSTLGNYLESVGRTASPYDSPTASGDFAGRDPRNALGQVRAVVPAVVSSPGRTTVCRVPAAADSSATLANYIAAVGVATSTHASPSSNGPFAGRDFCDSTRYYAMIAKSSLTGAWVTPWVVKNSPDTNGTQYPGPGMVDVTSIRILNEW